MTSAVARLIAEAVSTALPQVVEGGRQRVQLGDGTTPGVVVVPPTDLRYFPGAFYCFSVTGGTKTVHVVENRWPGLTYDNSPARTWVEIGYPAGSKQLAILGPVPGLTTQYSRGPMPAQAGLVQAMDVTPDRIATLRLLPQGTLVVGLTPGRYVIGETVYTVEATDTAFLDVSSYLPAGPDQDKWLLVGIDAAGDAQVTAGSAFAETAEDPGSFAPSAVPANCYLLGYIRLNDDLTGFEAGDNRIIPAQGLAAASGNRFQDDRFTVFGNLDATKQLQFQVDGLATATTVILTPPPASDTIVGLAATQILTNKTLTSPVINTPTISGGTINNAVIGGTTPAAGTFTQLTVSSGGNTQATISSTGTVVINEQGNDADFRVEGDTDANLLFGDASTNRIGIGLNAPQSKFHLVGTADEIQFRVVGFSGQTQPLADIQDGNAASVYGLSAAGVLTITNRTALTNTFNTAFLLQHNTSGTPAAGFGVRWAIRAESSTTENREQFAITTSWVVATDASRTARTILGVFDTAHRECIRIETSGAAPMLGVLGAAAVARQTVTGSRGGNAALASLLTALATFGLITDSSTA